MTHIMRIDEMLKQQSLNEGNTTNDIIIVYVDPNTYNNYYDVNSLDEFKQAARTDRSIHFYKGLGDFIEAFNNGYISDEGYLANPM